MLTLRPYQKDCFETTMTALETKDSALDVIPTGGGKTAVMAKICQYVNKWGGRCVVLSHVKELIDQTFKTLKRLDADLDVGIYSAGLNSRNTKNKILCAGIQSVYQRFDEIGKASVVMIDEAHLIPRSDDSRYRTFLNGMKSINPRLKIVGLTATPYRTDDGLIYGDGELFSEKTYEAGIVDLIQQGYLSPLRSKNGCTKVDESQLVLDSKGEFDVNVQAQLFGSYGILGGAVQDIWDKCQERKKILVFCPKIETCYDFKREWEACMLGKVHVVTGETDSKERAELIDGFRDGDIRILANCQVLTTGFDAPNVDAVILLRATTSAGLYYQMVGRGLRKAKGKEDCLILDYGGNIERHGPINAIRVRQKRNGRKSKIYLPITKVCPKCNEVITALTFTCPACNYQFPKPELNIDETASSEDILRDETKPEVKEYNVLSVSYTEPKEGKQEGARYMQVVYKVEGKRNAFRKFLGIEYSGYARTAFCKWFEKHVDSSIREVFGGLIPESCSEFQNLFIDNGAVAEPIRIKVKYYPDKEYPEVVGDVIEHFPTLEEVNARINARKQAQYNPDSYSYWENR